MPILIFGRYDCDRFCVSSILSPCSPLTHHTTIVDVFWLLYVYKKKRKKKQKRTKRYLHWTSASPSVVWLLHIVRFFYVPKRLHNLAQTVCAHPVTPSYISAYGFFTAVITQTEKSIRHNNSCHFKFLYFRTLYSSLTICIRWIENFILFSCLVNEQINFSINKINLNLIRLLCLLLQVDICSKCWETTFWLCFRIFKFDHISE